MDRFEVSRVTSDGLYCLGRLDDRFDLVREAKHGEMPIAARALDPLVLRLAIPDLRLPSLRHWVARGNEVPNWISEPNWISNHYLDPQGDMPHRVPDWHIDAATGMTHMLSCVLTDAYATAHVCGTEFLSLPPTDTYPNPIVAGEIRRTEQNYIFLAPLSIRHRSPACWNHRRLLLRYYLRLPEEVEDGLRTLRADVPARAPG